MIKCEKCGRTFKHINKHRNCEGQQKLQKEKERNHQKREILRKEKLQKKENEKKKEILRKEKEKERSLILEQKEREQEMEQKRKQKKERQKIWKNDERLPYKRIEFVKFKSSEEELKLKQFAQEALKHGEIIVEKLKPFTFVKVWRRFEILPNRNEDSISQDAIQKDVNNCDVF